MRDARLGFGWGLAGLDDLLICLYAVRLRREPYRYHREWPQCFWQPGKTDEEVRSLVGGAMLNFYGGGRRWWWEKCAVEFLS